MTDALPHVVVSYAEFLERRARRRRVASELERQDDQQTIDGEALAVAMAVTPVSTAQIPADAGCRLRSVEPTT